MNEEKTYTREQAKRTGWIMVVMCIVFATFGSTKLIWSLFSTDLIANNGWTQLQASLPFTAVNVVSGLGAIVAGMVADSKRPGIMAGFGGVMVGVSLILIGLFSDNWWVIFISAGILMGLGEVLTNMGVSTSAIKWLPVDSQGKATGVATCGLAVVSIVIPPIYTSLYASYGFKTALLVIGGITAVICMTIGFFFKQAPQSVIDRNREDAVKYMEDAAKNEKKATRKVFVTPYSEITWKEGLRTKEFWCMFVVFFVVMASYLALGSQIISIINTRVTADVPASLLLGCGAIGGVAGRVCGGQLGDKLGIFKAWGYMVVILAITFAIMPFTSSVFLLYFLYALNTFCVHAVVVYDYAAHGVLYNRQCSGLLTGIGSLAFSLSSIVGPTFASMCMDNLGSYDPVFYVFAVAVLLCFFIMKRMDRWCAKEMEKQHLTY